MRLCYLFIAYLLFFKPYLQKQQEIFITCCFLTKQTCYHIADTRSQSLCNAGLLFSVFVFSFSTLCSRRYVSRINFSVCVNFFNRWWLHVNDSTVVSIFHVKIKDDNAFRQFDV